MDKSIIRSARSNTWSLCASFCVLLLACAFTAPAWSSEPSDIPSSPLGMEPAVVEYVRNDAPFVVFDVAPRTLAAPRPNAKVFRDVELTFVATEELRSLQIYTYAVSARAGLQQAPTRTNCGRKPAGHHACTVSTREALLLLKGEGGQFGMRIEAEGWEGDRSQVRITLPVKMAEAKPVAPPVQSTQRLSFVRGRSWHPSAPR